MASPARWRELEALPAAALRAAYEASLRARQRLCRELGETETMPDALIRSNLAAWDRLVREGKSRPELVYYVASSEDVAARKSARLEARRAY